MAQLLSEYKDVFSCGDYDMGRAKAVCDEIPLAAGTVPIRQRTHRLGPEKKREVSRQVQDLLNRTSLNKAMGPGVLQLSWFKKRKGAGGFALTIAG